MHDDNQIHVPPSFMAVYSDARGRLTESADTVRTRYELCEDLAGHLVEQAQTLYHVQAPSEAEILRRIHAGHLPPRPGGGHVRPLALPRRPRGITPTDAEG